MGTSELEPTWTEIVSNVGTHYLQLVSEAEGNVMGLSL